VAAATPGNVSPTAPLFLPTNHSVRKEKTLTARQPRLAGAVEAALAVDAAPADPFTGGVRVPGRAALMPLGVKQTGRRSLRLLQRRKER
jgi:hypothetical protein